ncbi:MAG: TRAP transporter small permease [Desulfovibrio sp.]|nr:TRAP transporter small permease [Desulfovibrio sp.]
MFRFLDAHFEELLGSFLLAVMATVAFLNVIVRYCTSFSFAWTEELTVNFFVWVTLLGTARAFREGTHLAMSIVYNSLPKKGRLCCYLLACAITIIFFGSLIYTGSLEVRDEYELESISESLGIPVWWYTIATPLFSLLIIIRMLQRAWQDFRTGNF